METLTGAQFLSLLVIGIASFIFGVLPVIVSFRVTRSRPFFLSLILCLGAGVLLATSLVHMLTEVQVKLKLSAQLYFSAGFLTLYIFDEISHFFVRSKKSAIHPVTAESEGSQNRRSSYGAIHSTVDIPDSSSCLASNHNKKFETLASEKQESSHCSFSGTSTKEKYETEEQNLLDNYSSNSSNNAQDQDNQWTSNSVAETGLLIALLIHSVLEGISIGVQTKISQVLLIFGAVLFHKIVLSFCLGLELLHQGFKISHLLIALFFFSIGSPLGILIGMTATSLDKSFFDVDAQLQAIAAGSLFYVAALEVLPRERFKWQNKPNQRTAGIQQLIFVLIGFFVITIFHFFLG